MKLNVQEFQIQPSQDRLLQKQKRTCHLFILGQFVRALGWSEKREFEWLLSGGRMERRGLSIGMASGEARGSCARLCNDFPHLNRRAYVQSVWRVRERCAATARLSSVCRASTRVYLGHTGEYTLSHVCTRTIWFSPQIPSTDVVIPDPPFTPHSSIFRGKLFLARVCSILLEFLVDLQLVQDVSVIKEMGFQTKKTFSIAYFRKFLYEFEFATFCW